MINTIILVLLTVVNVAIQTLAERKLMGYLQRRVGPNEVGLLGVLQAVSDGVKQILKESLVPTKISKGLFYIAPIITFFQALFFWLFLPIAQNISITEINEYTLLIIMSTSELSLFGVLFAGWSANNKWALIGGLRSTAQMISYSICLSLSVLCVISMVNSLNLFDILSYQSHIPFALPLLPAFIIYFASTVAELNRAPFDLPEAESELVAGFYTEHSSAPFALFFLGEYCNAIVMSLLVSLYFLGTQYVLYYLFFQIWLRASLPRLRFDQLMKTSWKDIISLLIGFIIFVLVMKFSIINQ